VLPGRTNVSWEPNATAVSQLETPSLSCNETYVVRSVQDADVAEMSGCFGQVGDSVVALTVARAQFASSSCNPSGCNVSMRP
jgi:hypothetical protein